MSQGAKCFNTPIFHTTCLNKLVDEYNNTYHHSIGKKPRDADYYTLAEEIEWSLKAPKFQVGDRVRITK